MLAISVALVQLWAAQGGEAAGVVGSFIAAVFDPSWNLAHRTVIWGSILSVLFMSGLGLPLPEDVPLTLAGFTTFKQSGELFVLWHFAVAFGAVVIPILAGDLIAYSMGRRFGFGLRDRIGVLRRILSDKRLRRVQHWFDNYGSFTIFLGRQVAGVRFVTFFTAGTMRVPPARFVLFDFLGCLVSVPVWLTLGVLASRYGELWLHTALRKVGGGFMIGALLAFGILLLIVKLRGLSKPDGDTGSHKTARAEVAAGEWK